jgi:hypothetical protein
MKLPEYALESTALLDRIKNTATMINSYVTKFHTEGLLLAKQSSVADAAIKFVNDSPIPAAIRLMNIMPQEMIDDSNFELTVQSLERRLTTLNRICMQMQELHAMFVNQGKLK